MTSASTQAMSETGICDRQQFAKMKISYTGQGIPTTFNVDNPKIYLIWCRFAVVIAKCLTSGDAVMY